MKKNDKLKILLVLGIAFVILTWIVPAGSYQSGAFVSSGIVRAGIFDYLLIVYYALYYRASDIFYLLVLGGFYGVLSKTKGYRKLVSKTVNLIKGKEILAMLVVTLVMGVCTSITSDILPMLTVVPFIITVFLKRGKDRITALNAGFGGIFIGTFGLTVGTYGVGELISAMSLTVSDGLWFKIVMFVVSYGLYNLFAILHMKKQTKLVNYTQYDEFTTTKLDEKDIKPSKRQKIWPTLLFFSICLVITVIAYINWNDSFDVTIFDNLMTNMESVTISEVPVLSSFLGSFNAFGKWTDLLPLSFVLLVTTIVIALVNKVKVNEFLENFALGMKKISKIAVIYVFAMSLFVLSYYFSWPTTLINAILGNGSFNIFSLLIVAFLSSLLYVDPEYIGYILGTYLTATFADQLIATSLIMHAGYALSMILVPTSFILMIALSYLDIPYTKWLKYIWKFALAILVVLIILLAVMCYM